MQPFTKLVLAALVLTLSACSKSNSDGESIAPLVVPPDLPFDEKTLPAISDNDFINFLYFYKHTRPIVSPHKEFLEDTSEFSKKHGLARRYGFDWRPEVQTVANSLVADCNSKNETTPPAKSGGERGFVTGMRSHYFDRTFFSGEPCLASAKIYWDRKSFVIKADSKTSASADLTTTEGIEARYFSSNHQYILGLSELTSKLQSRSFVQYVEYVEKIHYRIGDLTAAIEYFSQFGRVTLTGKVTALKNDNLDRTIARLNLNVKDRTYSVTIVDNRKAPGYSERRVFIGNRELEQEDAKLLLENHSLFKNALPSI